MQAMTRGISMVETVQNPTAMSCWVISGKIAPFSMIFSPVALWESLSSALVSSLTPGMCPDAQYGLPKL